MLSFVEQQLDLVCHGWGDKQLFKDRGDMFEMSAEEPEDHLSAASSAAVHVIPTLFVEKPSASGPELCNLRKYESQRD